MTIWQDAKVNPKDKMAVSNLAGQYALSIARDLQSAFWDMHEGRAISGAWISQANASLAKLTEIMKEFNNNDLG